MIDIIQLTQTTLDTALATIPLRSFWLRRQEIDGDPDPDEYIVFSVDEHEPDASADGEILIYRSYVTVRYFCRDSWIGDSNKYAVIRNRMAAIRTVLIGAGFDCSSGWQDVGDVDGISFQTFVLSAEYTEVDRGNTPDTVMLAAEFTEAIDGNCEPG